jgi:hypothetical protein
MIGLFCIAAEHLIFRESILMLTLLVLGVRLAAADDAPSIGRRAR